MKGFLVGLSLFVMSGCVALTTQSLPDRNVSSDFSGRTITWTSGGKIVFGLKVYEAHGRVAFCGAYSERSTNIYTDQLNPTLMAGGSVTLAGDTLVRGLKFFKRGNYEAEKLPIGKATCVLTDRPPGGEVQPKEASHAVQPNKLQHHRLGWCATGLEQSDRAPQADETPAGLATRSGRYRFSVSAQTRPSGWTSVRLCPNRSHRMTPTLPSLRNNRQSDPQGLHIAGHANSNCAESSSATVVLATRMTSEP